MSKLRDLMKQQNGSVLLLVILAMLVLSVLSLPILASSTQGQLLSTRTQNDERANYAAESGIFVVKRLIKEFAKAEGSVYEEDVEAITSEVDSLALFDSDPVDVSFEAKDDVHYVVSNAEIQRSKRTIELAVVSFGSLSGGGPTDPSEAPGDGSEFYYNYDLIINDSNLFSAFKACRPNESLTEETTGVINAEDAQRYQAEFQSYFNYRTIDLVNLVPAAATSTAEISISGSRGGVNDYNGKIKFTAQTAEISGDVIARGDIVFESGVENIVINGDLRAGGKISFNNPIKSLTVTGNIISGGGTTFTNVNTKLTVGQNIYSKGILNFPRPVDGLEVGGSIISEQSILFDNINSTSGFSVKGDILANSITFFQPVNKTVDVDGYMLIGGNVNFKNINGNFTLGGYYAGGTTTFEGPINSPPICIDHTPPPVGGGGGGLVFGGWTGQ